MHVLLFLILIAIPAAEIGTNKGGGGIVSQGWVELCDEIDGTWTDGNCEKDR